MRSRAGRHPNGSANPDRSSRRGLLVNSLGALVSKTGLTAISLLSIIVLTRQLPKVEYGIYASSIALIYLVAPILEVGVNHLVARAVATRTDAEAMWQTSIAVHLLAAGLGGIALAAVQPVLLPESSLAIVFLLAGSELLGPGLNAGAVLASEAAGKAFVGARIRWIAVAIKATALGVFWLLPGPTLVLWCALQVGSSALAFVITVRSLDKALDLPLGFRLPTWREVRSGLAFTSNQVSATALKDLDKVMLGSFNLSAQNADYTAGHRFVALGLLPLQAAMSGSYGEFFRRGADGRNGLSRLTVRLSLAALPPMIVVAAVMYVAAPGIPWLLGAEYQDSVVVVRYLAFLPALKALQGFVGNALTARGDHGWRLANMVLAVSFNAALNLALIPRHGWRGAAVSTLVAEVLLTLGLWAALLRRGAGDPPEDDDQGLDLRARKTREAGAGSVDRTTPSGSSRTG